MNDGTEKFQIENIRHLRRLIMDMGLPMGVFDRDGRVLALNHQAALLGGGTTGATGGTIAHLFPDWGARYLGRIQEAFDTHKTTTFIDELDLPGGRRTFQATLQIVKGDPQQVLGVQVIWVDITRYSEHVGDLEEARRTLAEAQRIAHIGSWWYNPDTRKLRWTDELFHIFGLPVQPAPPSIHQLRQMVHPEDWRQYKSDMFQAVNKGIGFDRELRAISADGTTKYIRNSCEAKQDAEGRITELIGTTLDITQSKAAETALQESERWYRTIVENFPNGAVVMFDHDLRYTVAGGRILPKLGLSAEEMIGKTAQEVLLPEAFEQMAPHYHAALQGAPSWFEVSFKDRTFKIHALPIKDDDQNIVGAMSMSQDVTDQKETIERLLASEVKFRTMMEALTDLIYICSDKMIVEYMNPAMVKRLGQTGVGQHCYKVLHNLEAPCSWCVHNDVLQGQTVELTITSPKDNRTYRVTNIPIYNKDGTISKMSIFRDITDYLAAMDEKERAIIRLQQAQKMESIGTLAGGIAHDFNNILSSILGYTELALDDVVQGTLIEDNLQEVYTAGRRAKELVKQILTFARQTDEEIKPVRVDTIVKEAFKLIRASTPTTIDIRQHIQSNALVLANPTQLHQIVMNLCTNALHAMETQGGVMEIRLADVTMADGITPGHKRLTPGDYVCLSVSDTGDGIPEEIIDSVFEPYFTTKRPGEGTGMGLSVVHGIVKSYEGEIDVASKPGEGACFSIYLPSTKKSGPSETYHHDTLKGGTERILFVDDELPIVRMGSQTLSRLGYKVTERTSSVEALNLFRSRPDSFDLVITDMTMPNMSGDELTKALLTIRPEIPVILLTGYSKRVDEHAMQSVGISAYAYKPIVRRELASLVRKVLDGDNQLQPLP